MRALALLALGAALVGCKDEPRTYDAPSWRAELPATWRPLEDAQGRDALRAADPEAARLLELMDDGEGLFFRIEGEQVTLLSLSGTHVEGVCARMARLLEMPFFEDRGSVEVAGRRWQKIWEPTPKKLSLDRCEDDYYWSLSLYGPEGYDALERRALELLNRAEPRRGAPFSSTTATTAQREYRRGAPRPTGA